MRTYSVVKTRVWAWLFPVTYLIHIAEEYCGGYSAYLDRLRGLYLSPSKFLVVQGLALSLMVVGVVLARRFRFPNFFNVLLGSVVLVNGVTHLVQTVSRQEYSPGLITGVSIWLPLGVATLALFHGTMSRRRYWLAVALGVGVNIIVVFLTVRL